MLRVSKFLGCVLAPAGMAMMSGCAGVPGGGPQIAASVLRVNFGTVTTGDSNSQAIAVSNTGQGSLTISAISVNGKGFSISGVTAPLSIQPGNSSSFDVAFKPTSKASFSGSVALKSNAPDSPLLISLSGRGETSTHALSVSPPSLAFGNVAVGASAWQDVRLKNTGTSKITISGVELKGTGFSGSGVNAGLILGPNQTATLRVTFDPEAKGAENGSATIASNANNAPRVVALSGTGTASHRVALSWIPSTSPKVKGYNVYRGTVLGSYSRLNSSVVVEASYMDANIEAGHDRTYYYVVTAVNQKNNESQESDPVSVLVP